MCIVAAPVAAAAATTAASTTATAMTTMQMIAIMASVASTALTGVGMYMQGQQQAAAAKANANIAEANAKIADQKARDAEYRGRLDRQQISLNEEALRGTGRTGYASGNVQLGSGSPVDWEVDLTERAEADKRTSRYNSKVEAWGEKTSAQSSRYQASLYRSSASNYSTAGMIGAGGSLLAGAGTVADKYYTYMK